VARKPETLKNAPPPAPDAAGTPAPAKKKRPRLVMPLLILMLVSATAAGAWYGGLRNHPALAFAPKTASAGKKAQAFVPLEPFTVNLQDTDRERFLQLAVVLEVNEGNAADGVKQKLPIIRSQILLLLSSKRSADLQGVAAKQKLAGEIIAQARLPLESGSPDKGIEQVHFSQFIVQ
jgi:flagellar FliL protein